jgi:hypothetical protein
MEIVIAFIVGLACGRVFYVCTRGSAEGVTGEEGEGPRFIAISETEPKNAPEGDLKYRILQILRASPVGLSLSEIGTAMNRHFAALIGPMRLLIEQELVEKHDKLYKMRGTK